MQNISSSTEYYNQKIVIFSLSRTVLFQKDSRNLPVRQVGISKKAI